MRGSLKASLARIVTPVFCGVMACCAANANAAELQVPVEEADEFHFVILGDSQFHKPALFNRVIDQTRRLRPAFVIQVGDLIQGYNDDIEVVSDEWDRFEQQVAPLEQVPYIAIAGNHDVYNGKRQVDADMENLFEQRWGPLYFSFRYKNAEFIGLNADSTEGVNTITGKQLKWLRETLRKPGPTHRFVFIHRPPLMTSNGQQLHDLFKAHGVDHVFYGHHHHYHFFERDGVKYTMTNAAANSINTLDETGGMPHLLQVAIRADEVDVALIRADSIMPENAVHPRDNYDFFALNRELAPDEVILKEAGAGQYRFDIPLENSSEREVTVYTSCTSEDQRWQFKPTIITPVTLAKGSKQALEIKASYEANRAPESTPVCELRVPFQTSLGKWVAVNKDVNGKRK